MAIVYIVCSGKEIWGWGGGAGSKYKKKIKWLLELFGLIAVLQLGFPEISAKNYPVFRSIKQDFFFFISVNVFTEKERKVSTYWLSQICFLSKNLDVIITKIFSTIQSFQEGRFLNGTLINFVCVHKSSSCSNCFGKSLCYLYYVDHYNKSLG